MLPPDPDWTVIETTTKTDDEKLHGAGTGSAGAAAYNQQDSAEDIADYESSARWFGAVGMHKPATSYFRESQMVFWQMKTFSLADDLELSSCTLSDVVEWNVDQVWFKPTASDSKDRAITPGRAPVDFARRNYSATIPDDAEFGPANGHTVLGQLDYTELVDKNRWSELHAALEYELRSLADVLTAVHVHRLPLTALVERFNKKIMRFDKKWMAASVSVCTPTILVGGLRPCDPPVSAAAGS
jgi:hypothetical protein